MRTQATVLAVALLAVGGGAAHAADRRTPAQQREIARLEQRIARLARETEAVEDVAAIKALQAAYGYYLDRGAWDEVVALFTDDATIEYGNEGVYVGKPHIRAYFQRLGGGRNGLAPGQLDSRFLIMPVVTLSRDGTAAMGRWKDIALKGQYGQEASWGDGVYENLYVKRDGVWKIKALHRYTDFVAPYDKGWSGSTGEPDISIAARSLPADRPPTFRYDPYPGVFVAPYHPQVYVPAGNPELRGQMLPADAPRPEGVGALPAPPNPPAAAGSPR